MLYTVTLFLILTSVDVSNKEIGILEFEQFEIYSAIPIIDCTGEVQTIGTTGEKIMVNVCQTERLYYFMTGKDKVDIVVTGTYEI